jgi:riboflavin transporter FmnP
MLIIVAVAYLFQVTTILLIQEHGATWDILVPVVILGVVVPATLGVVVNYLYWLPRYRVPE